jgi:fermentation-respiration switch protein FrsA (DUF1100 family)
VKRLLYRLFVGEFSLRRFARSLVLIPVAVYLGLFFMAWLIPDSLIFRPPSPSYPDNDALIKINTSDRETIAGKLYDNPAATQTILFSHGNAEDLGLVEPFAMALRGGGFAVMTYDYRGYGRSTGSPSESNTYKDIEAVYQYLTTERGVDPKRIILHGRSIGSGPSVELASRVEVGGLILESSFTSIARILFVTRILPFDHFDNLSKIDKVRCPVLVIHGTEDRTIPISHGEKLYDAVPTAKRSLWVKGAGHNDVYSTAGNRYLNAIRDFAQDLTPP